MNESVKGLVSGKVQGVWFRRFVKGVAEEQGVAGYAKNLADGCVEVLLCGEPDAVAAVKVQVAIGPPGAHVDAVEWSESPQRGITDFTVC